MNWDINLLPKQELYMQCPADEQLLGGAIGSGKSVYLICKAFVMGTQNKGIHIGLFRRTLVELRESLLLEALTKYPEGMYTYKVSERKIILPNGSQITFNYIDNDADLQKHRSISYDVLMFDEAGDFTDYQLIYMKTRLRTAKGYLTFRPRIYYAANPVGIGKHFLKKRFIDGKKPYQIYTTPESSPTHKTYQCFIPAGLYDNVHLVKNDPNYLIRLSSLDHEDFKSLVLGSWHTKVGQFFTMFDFKKHVVSDYIPHPTDQLFLTCDWGTAKPFAVFWIALKQSGNLVVYREYYGIKNNIPDLGLNLRADTVAKTICNKTPYEEKPKYMVLDSACWISGGHGVSIYELIQNELNTIKLPVIKSTKDRINNLELLRIYLSNELNNEPMLTISKSCQNLIRTLPTQQYSKTDQGDIDSRGEDHCIDSLVYFLASRPRPKALSAPKLKEFTVEWYRRKA